MGSESIPEGTFVLIVDDDPRVRTVVLRMVASASHEAVGVATGAEALALAERYPNQISCIILDVHMPDMTGLEVVAALRSRGLGTPVILSSGDALPDDASADGERTYFLKKPYLRPELLSVLERAGASSARAM